MQPNINIYVNKKVLLRERKRHTTHHVASTPYVVLTGYPPCPDLAGGYPTWVPPLPLGRVPPRQGTPWQGTPQQGTPQQGTPPGRVPPSWTWQGTPPRPGRVPPLGVCPMAFWEMLQSIMGYGYPPPVDRQMEGQTRVKTLPSRRTTYAGGNN